MKNPVCTQTQDFQKVIECVLLAFYSENKDFSP